MKAETRSSHLRGLVPLLAAAAMAAVPSVVSAAPVYNYGDSGVFGHPETWDSYSPAVAINSLDDAYSARFTALESFTADNAYLYYSGLVGTPTARIGIQTDASGVPSGTWLNTPGVFNPTAGRPSASFTAVSLTANTVYHLVVEPVDLGGPSSFAIYGSSTNNAIRPYDRAGDTSLNSLAKVNGGAWTTGKDPFFVLADGSNIIVGPGQPYTSWGAPANGFLSSTATSFNGEQFVITDKEVPAGAKVEITEVTFAAALSATPPTNNLLLRLRDSVGTVLATATMTPADADGAVHTFSFDQTATLTQGQTYLFTTEFSGTGSQAYKFRADRSDGVAGASVTNWGGTTVSFPIVSTAANNWSVWSPRGDRSAFDLVFGLYGSVVVPEPASVALLALGTLVLVCPAATRRTGRKESR
ncbi:MAG: hypothetical protein IT444_12560 [Phycisphaeraceae bacterium]|nr:hypothetical protein [Phycisphaeraceae bacterium]